MGFEECIEALCQLAFQVGVHEQGGGVFRAAYSLLVEWASGQMARDATADGA